MAMRDLVIAAERRLVRWLRDRRQILRCAGTRHTDQRWRQHETGPQSLSSDLAERGEELDHFSARRGVRRPAAPGGQIVFHMGGITGARDHRGYCRFAEQVFDEALPP